MYNLRSTDEPPTERTEFPELPRRRRAEDELAEQHRSGYWVAIFLLAIAIGGLCWYGYPTLKQVPALVAQFPGLQKSFEGMNARLAATESQIKAWGANHQQLQDRIAEVETTAASGIQAARKQAQALSEKVYQRVHGEVATQTQATDEKLARLESANESNFAKLRTEVASLREETARQAQQLSNVRSDMERDGANRDQQLVSLNQQVGNEARDVESINNKLAVKRVDFEITRNHSQQLTDDLSLGITGTDVTHRRVTGWMWVMPDRRTIRLQKQAAQQPVVWYGIRDGKRREVVITNVAKNSVSGYVLLPVEGSSTVSAGKGD
jgi:3-phenylpropionate/cinnamic acid dioxygenase small subunit